MPDDDDSDFNEYSDEECEVEVEEQKHSIETKLEPKKLTIKVGNKHQQLSFMDDYTNDYDPYKVY